jgi:excisionase family DNA binding protein
MTERSEADPWLTYQEAAQIVGVHVNTIRRAVRREQLEVTRVSHTVVRMRRSALDRWMDPSTRVGWSLVDC